MKDGILMFFGDKNDFAIEYGFEDHTADGDDSVYGYMGIWIEGQDICMYDGEYKFKGNLYLIVEWFCEKIEYILGYDAFPLPVKGDTILELIENAEEYDSEDDLEFDLWFSGNSRWIFNHFWLSVREGNVMPGIYFRRLENKIEIAWDNIFWEKYNIVFNSRRDFCLVSLDVFITNFTDFLYSILDELSQRVNDSIDSLDSWNKKYIKY